MQSFLLSVLVSRFRQWQSTRLMLHSSQHWGCSSMLTFRASKKVLSGPARILAHENMIPLSSLFPMLFALLTSKPVWNPHQVWPLMTHEVVYHHMNCALWCTLLLLILHQHFAHLTWWMWASALSHFLCASWSCSLQSALLQSQLFAFLLSIHPCIIRHISYSHLSMKTPKEFLHLQSTVGYFLPKTMFRWLSQRKLKWNVKSCKDEKLHMVDTRFSARQLPLNKQAKIYWKENFPAFEI